MVTSVWSLPSSRTARTSGESLSCLAGIVGDEDAKESGALPGPYKPVPGARLIKLDDNRRQKLLTNLFVS